MSLVNEYRNSIRGKLGLSEEDPALAAGGDQLAAGSMGGLGEMDENTLNSVLELIQREIAKREAVGEVEPEGMEDPAAKSVAAPEAPMGTPADGAKPGAKHSENSPSQFRRSSFVGREDIRTFV